MKINFMLFFLFFIGSLFFSSCSHLKFSKEDKSPKMIIESKDKLIKSEPISITDNYDTKISKLLTSAYINYKNNDFPKAITNYETAIIFSESLEFWDNYTLAYCYLAVGNYEKSAEILQALIEERPEIADSFVLLGYNYLKTNKYKHAIEQFNRALSLETHSPRTYYYLSLAKKIDDPNFDDSSLISKALEEYTEILSKNPNDFEILMELSYLHAVSSSSDKAREYLSRAKIVLNLSPEVEEISYQQRLAPYQNPIWSYFYLNFIEGIILNLEKKYSDSNHIFLVALQIPPSGSKLDIAEIYYYISKNFLALKNQASSDKAYALAKDLNPFIDKR